MIVNEVLVDRVFLCIEGLDVTGAIITHDVRGCTGHRVTDALYLRRPLW